MMNLPGTLGKNHPIFTIFLLCWEEVEVAGMKSHRESKMLSLIFFFYMANAILSLQSNSATAINKNKQLHSMNSPNENTKFQRLPIYH